MSTLDETNFDAVFNIDLEAGLLRPWCPACHTETKPLVSLIIKRGLLELRCGNHEPAQPYLRMNIASGSLESLLNKLHREVKRQGVDA